MHVRVFLLWVWTLMHVRVFFLPFGFVVQCPEKLDSDDIVETVLRLMLDLVLCVCYLPSGLLAKCNKNSKGSRHCSQSPNLICAWLIDQPLTEIFKEHGNQNAVAFGRMARPGISPPPPLSPPQSNS